MKNDITEEGIQEIIEASTHDNPKLLKGVRKIIRGFEERRGQFGKKKREIEDVIERGARQTNHKLLF